MRSVVIAVLAFVVLVPIVLEPIVPDRTRQRRRADRVAVSRVDGTGERSDAEQSGE